MNRVTEQLDVRAARAAASSSTAAAAAATVFIKAEEVELTSGGYCQNKTKGVHILKIR